MQNIKINGKQPQNNVQDNMLVRGSPEHKAITHNNFWGILGGKTVPKLAKQRRPTQTRLAALLPSNITVDVRSAYMLAQISRYFTNVFIILLIFWKTFYYVPTLVKPLHDLSAD